MLVNAAGSGNGVTKTGGCSGCPDSGAVSRQKIDLNGYVEFTASETDSLRAIGLGESATDPGSLLFSIRLQGTTAEVREGGVYKSETPFATGDVLRIAVAGGGVTYSRNGHAFFTSTGGGFPMYVDVMLYDLSASITNVMIATASPAPAAAALAPRSRAGVR
jgi:hypothetical protein